jgi:thymidylate synthase (FAD)
MADTKQSSIRVLDHGSVILVDHMASDIKVVGAARVSTGKRPDQASRGKVADRKLIRRLMSNGHGTPFEHAVFQFFIDTPLFVAREWQRHRMASYNEFSMRYAELPPEPKFYVPTWARIPDPDNKQSSVLGPSAGIESPAAIDWHNEVRWSIKSSAELAINTYRTLLNQGGVAREMARMVLPVNVYTQFWFTVNARSLMNFIALRTDPGAQYEIQEYARALEVIFRKRMPLTHAAFEEFGRNAP